MRKFITTIPALTIFTTFTTAINTALAPLLPFKISLTNEEKKGMRSMAEGREGFARLIGRIANQFPNSLSRVDTPAEFNTLMSVYENVEATRMALLQALETIEEIGIGTATDIMTLVDRYGASLEISRGSEGALDLAMKEVDEYNARFGKRNAKAADKPADDAKTE
jgi:hypothetical protein